MRAEIATGTRAAAGRARTFRPRRRSLHARRPHLAAPPYASSPGLGEIPIVTGFLARAKTTGAVATLGRGGSDLTATVLGRALCVKEVQVWKDVDGVLTADPRVVHNAVPVPFLTYEEATELARSRRRSFPHQSLLKPPRLNCLTTHCSRAPLPPDDRPRLSIFVARRRTLAPKCSTRRRCGRRSSLGESSTSE